MSDSSPVARLVAITPLPDGDGLLVQGTVDGIVGDCPACIGGERADAEGRVERCPACSGEGKLPVLFSATAWRSHLYADHDAHDAARASSRWFDYDTPCEGECGGRGTIDGHDPDISRHCDDCEGTGYKRIEPPLLTERLTADEGRREYLKELVREAARELQRHRQAQATLRALVA